jgi:YD repeat-containing protein
MWECQPSGCGNAGKDRELDFSYDLAGREAGEADPTIGVVNYSYSLASEINSITNSVYNNSTNPGTYVSSVVNTPAGPSSYHLGNGLNAVMTYDSSLRSSYKWLCAGVSTSLCSGGTQLYGMETNWQGSYLTNRIDIVTNSGGSLSYDEFGRLKALTANLGQPISFTWTYDRWGNRWSQTPGDSVSFNTMNHKIDGSTTYDAAGNVRKDAYHQYTYDAENNLISVDNGSTASYVYDALNQRVQVKVPSAGRNTLEYTYDFAGRRVTTWDANANFGIQGQL